MARSILDVVIKLSKQGGADKETIKGLVQVKSAILEAAAVAGTLVAAGYTIKKAFDATVGASVELANKVRSVKEVTGLSAEESSKLIQITDDLKISFEDLYKVMQKNGDQYDYSVAGLAKMSDEYLALESSTEKADYMQERFGKSWGNFVELMEQGSTKIIVAGEGINKALIFDDKALQQAREYEKNVDNVEDAILAYKVAVGNELLPVLNDLFTVENRVIQLMEDGLNPYEARRQATQELMSATEDLTQVEEDHTAALESIEEAIKSANQANQEFLSTLGSMQSSEESYQNTAKALTEERIGLELEKQVLLAQGYTEESQNIQDINAKLAENSADVQANADVYELANKRIMLGLLERKLMQDGILDDRETQWLLDKGVAWGVYSQTVVDQTRAAIDEANSLIEGLITERTFTLSLATQYSTYGDSARPSGSGARYATGTRGWEKVPAGFPNDTFPIWLSSDEEYAVIPAGGNGSNLGVSTATGGGGGGAVYMTVNIQSLINTADREQAKRTFLPLFQEAYRISQGQGVVR